MGNAKKQPRTLADRVKDCLGGFGSYTRFSRATGISQVHTNRIMNGSGYEPKEYVFAIVELLEVVKDHAPQYMPERWKPSETDKDKD